MDKNLNLHSRKEKFFQKVFEVHGNKYDYSLSNYVNSTTKISIICPIHGKFEQTPPIHLKCDGCPKCSLKHKHKNSRLSTEEFIQKAIKIHGKDHYNYSKSVYVKSAAPVIIICNRHGEFLQQPSNHLFGNGCPVCGTEKAANSTKLGKEEFIKRSNKTHKNLYDYSLVDYINSNSIVKILCQKHGVFLQTPNNHYRGQGCPKCNEGWHLNNWEDAADASQEFESFKFYIIKCSSKKEEEAESFFKIGRTFQKFNRRLNRALPYNWELVLSVSNSAEKIVQLEREMKEKNAKFKYVPKVKFCGWQECFSKINFDLIIQ